MTFKLRKKQKKQIAKYGLPIAIVVVVLVLLAAGVFLYAQTSNNTSTGTAKSPSPSASPSTNPINPYSGAQSSTTPAPKSTAPIPTPTNTASSSNLTPPTGDLLSANPASLGATASESSEESTCQTVLGASCEIVLVSPSGQTTSFSAPSVNSQGLHLVDWKVSQYISSTGTWKVYAREALNNETADSNIYTFRVNP
jgi:cytoskeletal protein RodZ